MACSSTFLKYPLAVLAQTPAAYILMDCNAFSTTFTAVRCFQLQLSPFFRFQLSPFPQKRLILRLRITRDEIITGYNTKAVNVDAYQKRANNSTQHEKVTNETRQQMNNLFQRLLSVRSFRCRESIFSYLRRAVFILSQANFYSIHFLKVRHFPGKIDNKPLPGVFLEAALPLQ